MRLPSRLGGWCFLGGPFPQALNQFWPQATATMQLVPAASMQLQASTASASMQLVPSATLTLQSPTATMVQS